MVSDAGLGLGAALFPRWTRYIPHKPYAKQLAAMMLPHKEVLFGGAAGSGKSDWLLMCGLQYVDVPGYSAIIFRKTLTDLQLEGNLIPRSHDWLSDTPAKWDGQKHCWYFPCGPNNRWDRPDWSLRSVLQFGYMGVGYGNVLGMQKRRYQSAEFQFVGFDELTQHFEEDYKFLFSRLRSKQCPVHSHLGFNNRCRECREAYAVSKVPLRFRSATNPGGIGAKWVKERFKIKRVGIDSGGHAVFRGHDPKRPYIPARVEDNASIKLEEYAENLAELGRVERTQLRWGDWEVAAEGRFQRDWFKLYSIRGDMVVLGSSHNAVGVKYYPLKSCIRFMTLDPAASIKEGPGDRQIWANANPSRTACCSWLMTPAYDLLWVHTLAHYLEVPDILPVVRREAQQHRPDWIGIENNGFNLAIYQEFQRSGLTVQPFSPLSGDKLVRSTPAQVRAERGKVFIPEASIGEEWLEDSLSEVCNWTGHPQEVDDIVDNLAYAGDWVHNQAIGEGGQRMFPTASK